MPGGLHGAAPGIAQRGLQEGDAVRGQPLADDAQFGLGLYGDVEPDRALGPFGGAPDPEAPAPLGVGACPVGDAGDGVREHVGQRSTATEPGERLVREQRGRLPASAGSGEHRDRSERHADPPVSGEGGEA